MADRRLDQDFDAHALFTFSPIPDAPPFANISARLRRWFVIAFAESWLAILLYRTKARLRRAGIPLLPGACDLVSRALFRVQIGDRADIGPGLMITHGNVVIDGKTKVGRNCQINPWVTIGLSNSRRLGFSVEGPTIGDNVHIGTGAKVLGPVAVGDYARIGANAVVVDDVPPNVTVVGIPARVVGRRTDGGKDGDGRTAADEQIGAAMRTAIVDYKLRRRSLGSLVGALTASFDAGSDHLRDVHETVKDDLIFLGAVAAADGDETHQVVAAVEVIDSALADIARAPA